MNLLQKISLIAATMLTGVTQISAQATSRVYGIQIYGDSEPEGVQKLVSFSVDDPGYVTVEQDLSDYTIVAAAAHDGIYYMFHSDDGMVPSKYLTYDIAHKTITEVKDLDFNFDEAACLVILDMTYDMGDQLLYAVAADLRNAEVVEGSINAPFGLYWINPENGDAELVGLEEVTTITTLAAGQDELWGIDESGDFWLLDRWTGMPQDILWSTGILPVGIQSMSYDMDNNCFYWASFTFDEMGKPTSNLISIELGEEWDISMSEHGKIGDNLELIGMYVDSNPVDPNAPGEVTSLMVEAAEGGIRDVTLSWKNPSYNMKGDKLESELTLTIYRNDAKVGEVTGQPGEDMSWTDHADEDALYSYSVTASSGDYTGQPVYASPVFVGTDVPGAPLDVKAIRESEGYGISVVWKAPAEGEHGGWFDATDLHYSVTRYPDNTVVAADITDLSFTDNSITTQEGYSYGIKVVAGEGFGPEAVSNIVVSGQPLLPPYHMTLTQQDERMWTVWNGDGDEYSWYVHRTGWGGTWDPMFRYYPENTVDPQGKADDWIISPSFELKAGKKYLVSYDIRLLGVLFPTNSSLWIGTQAAPDAMTEKLASFQNEIVDMVWENRTVPVTVGQDGSYNFGYKVENLVPVQLMNFCIREVVDVDLMATTLTGPTTLAEGEEVEFMVGVENSGFEAVNHFSVSLLDGEGNILTEQSYDNEIKAGDSMEVAISWTPKTGGNISLTAKVETENDAISENNVSTPLNVNVMSGGNWIDVAVGNSSTGFSPINCSQTYSAAQTIYNAELLTECEGKQIEAINYYLDICRKNINVELEVWMGVTDMAQFEDITPVSEADLIKVFSGTVTLEPGAERLTIMLDTPYQYIGSNLLIFTRAKVDLTALIAFKSKYNKNDPNYSLVESNNDSMFDFSQEMMLSKDLPDISVMVSSTTGVKEIPAVTNNGVDYDRATREINIYGDYNLCRVYTTSGLLVASFNKGDKLKVPASASGIGIVEIVRNEGNTVTKIVF